MEEVETKIAEEIGQENLKILKNLLLDKKTKTEKNLEFLRETTKSSTPANNGGSAYGIHMAEQGTDAMEREKVFLFIQRDEKYLMEINLAIQRMKKGTYGICRVTGDLIDVTRLKAVPTTTISYKAKIAIKNNGGNGRHRR